MALTRKSRGRPWSPSHLQELIEEACVDAYNESEQEGGFLVGLEEHFECPCPALVIGEAVTILGFDIDRSGRGLVARIRRKGKSYQVNVTALEWTGRPPKGADWIAAYVVWSGGTG